MKRTSFRFIPFTAFCDRLGLTGPAMLRRDGSAATTAETLIYNAEGECIAKVMWNFRIDERKGQPRYMIAVDPIESSNAYSEVWL